MPDPRAATEMVTREPDNRSCATCRTEGDPRTTNLMAKYSVRGSARGVRQWAAKYCGGTVCGERKMGDRKMWLSEEASSVGSRKNNVCGMCRVRRVKILSMNGVGGGGVAAVKRGSSEVCAAARVRESVCGQNPQR